MKRIIPHLGAILLFLLLTFLYLSPKLEGDVLPQGDVEKWKGMAKEIRDFYDKEGEASLWTGSMFGGMPAYFISVLGTPANFLSYVQTPIRVLGRDDAAPLFLGMLMMYLLCIIIWNNSSYKETSNKYLGVIISILGAVAYAFSSYSIIILEAGHVTKAWAIGYMPLVVAGLYLVFNKKLISGGILFALALSLELMSNHVQITYYLALFGAFLFVGYAVKEFLNNKPNEALKSVGKALGVLLIGVIIAISTNLPLLFAGQEMSKTSIRGKSELSKSFTGKETQTEGLDLDYAFTWSYGKAETLTLLSPNVYGGASGGKLGKESNLNKAIMQQGYQSQDDIRTYTYWGDQPFTSGPIYLGAIICFLAIFSLTLSYYNSKKGMWILIFSLLSMLFFIVLSWGGNAMSINKFLFNNMPLYNKFRTPSMALVIPQLAFVIMAVFAVIKLTKVDTLSLNQFKKPLYIAGGIVGVVLATMILMPTLFFDFTSVNDAQLGMPQWYLDALILDREGLMKSDAIRSLLFIAVAFASLFMLSKKNMQKYKTHVIVFIALLILVDLWSVDRRYLSSEDYKKKSVADTFVKTKADEFILSDSDLSYRVLNLNNPFNDTHVSYFHKSIGGYHAAKLKRYQELIELKLTPEINNVVSALQNAKTLDDLDAAFYATPVLNMLNMRYLIYNNDATPATNKMAQGNCWFVNAISMAENADEEVMLLGANDLTNTAIVNKEFAAQLEGLNKKQLESGSAFLTEYKPNELRYEVSSENGGVVIFSEVYYDYGNGWKAYINDKEVPHFRANWILRGLVVPAGDHEVVFKFEPTKYLTMKLISQIISSLLILLALAYVVKLKIKK